MPQKTPKKFWQFRNAAQGEAELLLYGTIAEESWYEDDVTSKQFANEMAAVGDVGRIIVRIDSPGGDPFAAEAIGNLLEQHTAQTVARIDGLCASSATIIASHCDKVEAAPNSTYMIHPVKVGLTEYADEKRLQECIDAIRTLRENILNVYARKTGRSKDEVAAWMDNTTWMTGTQAKENGFVDELLEEKANVKVENRSGVLFINSADMGIPFEKAPQFVQDSLAAAPAASGFVNNGAETEPENTNSHKEETEMAQEIKTTDDLRSAYPSLVDQVEQAAAQNAANAERQRIRDIEEMALPGSESVTNEAKFEKPISASDYAVAVVKNAKAKGSEFLAGMKEDAAQSGAGAVQATPADNSAGDEFMNAIKAANSGK